jgi:hypothetical protein
VNLSLSCHETDNHVSVNHASAGVGVSLSSGGCTDLSLAAGQT